MNDPKIVYTIVRKLTNLELRALHKGEKIVISYTRHAGKKYELVGYMRGMT